MLTRAKNQWGLHEVRFSILMRDVVNLCVYATLRAMLRCVPVELVTKAAVTRTTGYKPETSKVGAPPSGHVSAPIPPGMLWPHKPW